MSNNNQPHQATENDSQVAIVKPKRQEEDEAELKWRRLEDELAALKLHGLQKRRRPRSSSQ